jgi:hypothetical protein
MVSLLIIWILKNMPAEPLPYTAMQGPGDMILLVSAE